MSEYPFNPENLEVKKSYYEKLLWQRVEGISKYRELLENEFNSLYEEISGMNIEDLDSHKQEERMMKEKEYWRLNNELNYLKEEEEKIQRALLSLEEGVVNPGELDGLIKEPEPEIKKLSKKKQKLLEERKKLREDLRNNFDYDLRQQEFGSEKNRLSTGRHAKSIKGSLDSHNAENEFVYRTADTHGGKVKSGKKVISVSVKAERLSEKNKNIRLFFLQNQK